MRAHAERGVRIGQAETRTGEALAATNAIQVGSYQVPQHFVKHGFTGDPSMLTIPAAEQHRKDYVFLVPGTFDKNFAVFAKPVDADIQMPSSSGNAFPVRVNAIESPAGDHMGKRSATPARPRALQGTCG